MTTSSVPAATSRRTITLWILSIFICFSVMLQYMAPHMDPLLKEGNEFMERWLSKDAFFSPAWSIPETVNGTLQQQKDPNDPNNNDAPRPVTLRIAFSTSCTDQQHWESYVFFYHAMKVQQPGHVTRIASGCNAEQAEKLQAFHNLRIQPMSPNFHLHLTPDFSRVRLDQGKFGYKYMNKPFGLRHWMEQALGMNNETTTSSSSSSSSSTRNSIEDDVVILMDPDMILLRPLLHDFTDDPHILWVEDNPVTKRVKHGFPIAQQDGYLSNEWMYYNTSYIVQDPSFVMARSDDGPRHYNTGPPYLATVRDMYRIAVLWTKYAPRVFDDHPVLFAEMYGYVLATVHLKLPHTLIKSIVVSTTTAYHREGWPLVDALPDDQLCHPRDVTRLPVAFHYCKRYYAGPWFFSKYRLKKNYISCQAPIMAFPPPDIYRYDYWIRPPKDHEPAVLGTEKLPLKNQKQVRREAYMLCGLIYHINEASRYYKQNHCANETTTNWDSSYTVHNSPGDY